MKKMRKVRYMVFLSIYGKLLEYSSRLRKWLDRESWNVLELNG